MAKIIGIDLGTTNSVVAVMEAGAPKIINNSSGARTTPSVVGFTSAGERLVGQRALNQAITNPENTVYSIKRFMGRRRGEVKEEEQQIPYNLTGTADDPVKVNIRGTDYSPPEIAAMVLSHLKQYAEDYLNEKITEAVITVPAYFNDAQRQATKDAGEIAGLKVRRIINEPTAAALSYGLDKKVEQKVLVFDLGGGTFDVSILEIGDGVIEVRSTNGDTHLGGDNFDQVLINYVADEFMKSNELDLRKDKLALQRLREVCEKTKCELSSSMSSNINLPFITQVDGTPVHLTQEVTRAKFNTLVKGLIERTRQPMAKALEDAGMGKGDIDEIIMVGGSTRIPAVQDFVRSFFNNKELNKSVNPDEVVASGAAIQGAVLSGDKNDILLLDVTPLSFGVETAGGVMTPMIPRNTTIPTSKKETFTTFSNSQTAVDVQVYQGERRMAADNRLLGLFRLDEIPPAPKGIPKIDVTFDIDANGILNVTAKDQATGREQHITIEADTGISEAEIEKMKQEAEQYAEEDAKRVALVEAKNSADHIIDAVEKQIEEHPEQLAGRQEEVVGLLAKLKEVRGSDDFEQIQGAMAALEAVQHEIAQELYAKAQQEGAPPVSENGVVEAEVAEAEVVDAETDTTEE